MPSKYVKTPGGVFVPGEQYTYESSELFFSMAQIEYQNEKERTSTLDSKLGISLPVISAYFFMVIQDTNIGKLLESAWNYQKSPVSKGEYIALALYLVAALAAIISLFHMVRAVMNRNYGSVDMKAFYTAKEMSRPKEQFLAIMINAYLVILEYNRKQNSQKAMEYQTGWIFYMLSLLCFFLYAFF